MVQRRICSKCKTLAVRPADGNYSNLICLWCGGESFSIEGESERGEEIQLGDSIKLKNDGIKEKSIPKFSHHTYCSECGMRVFQGKNLKCQNCGGVKLIKPSTIPQDLKAATTRDNRYKTLGNFLASLGVSIIASIALGTIGVLLFLVVKFFKFLDFEIPVISQLPTYGFFLPILIGIFVILNNQRK